MRWTEEHSNLAALRRRKRRRKPKSKGDHWPIQKARNKFNNLSSKGAPKIKPCFCDVQIDFLHSSFCPSSWREDWELTPGKRRGRAGRSFLSRAVKPRFGDSESSATFRLTTSCAQRGKSMSKPPESPFSLKSYPDRRRKSGLSTSLISRKEVHGARACSCPFVDQWYRKAQATGAFSVATFDTALLTGRTSAYGTS
jgi:hypothetical protein